MKHCVMRKTCVRSCDESCSQSQDVLYSVHEDDQQSHTQDVQYLCRQQDKEDRPSSFPTYTPGERNFYTQEEYDSQDEPRSQGPADQYFTHEGHRYLSTEDVQYLHEQQHEQLEDRPCFWIHDQHASMTNDTETDCFYLDKDYPMHDPGEQFPLVKPVVDAEQHLAILYEVIQTMHSLNEALNNVLGRYNSRAAV
ncbi:hypothetical protein EST38_g14654 [Candolleomyces aberdarensis]|uniref:Uncharacterized protein n=1 Tax=Candolleomyces aberdarensis TaxID=2316362 RepID=A0A4Q2CZ36_9AGAR|nr:hypothetical protein EST38_g14654 [Candolleomyces aberdarensis]